MESAKDGYQTSKTTEGLCSAASVSKPDLEAVKNKLEEEKAELIAANTAAEQQVQRGGEDLGILAHVNRFQIEI